MLVVNTIASAAARTGRPQQQASNTSKYISGATGDSHINEIDNRNPKSQKFYHSVQFISLLAYFIWLWVGIIW